MNFTVPELTALTGQYLWPLTRIGGMIALAPIFGTRTVPARVKVILMAAIAFMVAPLVESPTDVQPISLDGVAILAQELMIGAMIGFAVALIFNALITGGQIIAQLMGLGFASMMDPQNGVSVPVIGQFYTIMATLLFLTMNGHLLLIEMVTSSFQSLPIGAELSRGLLLDFVIWGKWVFIGALMIALPALVALLIVNIAFGVMTRSSPQLNIFAIGFPITIAVGFVIMIVTLPDFAAKVSLLLDELFGVLRRLIAG